MFGCFHPINYWNKTNLFCQTNDQFTNCFCADREVTLPHCCVPCVSALELSSFTLCVYLHPHVSLKPALYLSPSSRSCHSDLSDSFCFVVCRCLSGERGQGSAAGRGPEPQAEQPAAAGGVAEHSGPPHQSHRAAVQRQQALLASPLHTQNRNQQTDANPTMCFYAQHTSIVHV